MALQYQSFPAQFRICTEHGIQEVEGEPEIKELIIKLPVFQNDSDEWGEEISAKDHFLEATHYAHARDMEKKKMGFGGQHRFYNAVAKLPNGLPGGFNLVKLEGPKMEEYIEKLIKAKEGWGAAVIEARYKVKNPLSK